MPEVDDLSTGALHNAAHDIDGGVVPVKQEAAVTIRTLFWLVGCYGLHSWFLVKRRTNLRKFCRLNLKACQVENVGRNQTGQ